MTKSKSALLIFYFSYILFMILKRFHNTYLSRYRALIALMRLRHAPAHPYLDLRVLN